MNNRKESNTPYTLALAGLSSMTLGGIASSKTNKEKTPESQASEPVLLGQLPRASKFSPQEIVSVTG
eukprot:2638451-Rhodomonas_salina.3